MLLSTFKLLKLHRLMDETTAGTGGQDGTATGGAAGDANAGAGTTQKPNENNTGTNENPFANMWNTEPAAGANGGDPNAAQSGTQPAMQQQQVTVAPTPPTPEQVFDTHFESLNIGNTIDMREVVEGVNQNNPEKIIGAFNAFAKDIYRSALVNTNKMMETKVEAAVEAAVSKSKGEFDATLAINELNASLPFTREPEIAPIAKAVFKQFVKSGDNVESAIKKTGEYFSHTFNVAKKHLNLQTSPNARPGSGGFANGGNPDGADEDSPDWLDILSGG